MCSGVRTQLEGHIINRKSKDLPVMALICVLVVTAVGLDKAYEFEPLFDTRIDCMVGIHSYEMM